MAKTRQASPFKAGRRSVYTSRTREVAFPEQVLILFAFDLFHVPNVPSVYYLLDLSLPQ
jgi:hypothetical protein